MTSLWVAIPIWITAVGIWMNVYITRQLHKLYVEAIGTAYERGYRDGVAELESLPPQP